MLNQKDKQYLSEVKSRLFDGHGKLTPSEQYKRIYLLNDNNEIVLSVTYLMEMITRLEKCLDKCKEQRNTEIEAQYNDGQCECGISWPATQNMIALYNKQLQQILDGTNEGAR